MRGFQSKGGRNQFRWVAVGHQETDRAQPPNGATKAEVGGNVLLNGLVGGVRRKRASARRKKSRTGSFDDAGSQGAFLSVPFGESQMKTHVTCKWLLNARTLQLCSCWSLEALEPRANPMI